MSTVLRPSGRAADQLREVRIERGYTRHAEGSVLVAFGDTRVLCTASVDNRVPQFLRGKGEGWVTAEYGMLPRATHTRGAREAAAGKQSGRTQEIQRLIGRSLRAVTDLARLGERQVTIDCDVLQADGGTRTAAITGGYVALADAMNHLRKQRKLKANPLVASVAAVSVGVVQAQPRLDLNYIEDSVAQTDMNVVLTGEGKIIEVQAATQTALADDHHFDEMENAVVAGERAEQAEAWREVGTASLRFHQALVAVLQHNGVAVFVPKDQLHAAMPMIGVT